MSIENLCKGDKVTKQVATTTAGAMGGKQVSYADVSGAVGIDCLIQDASASEAVRFDARGERHLYNVFFSEDVGLTKNHGLKWTVQDNQTLSPPVYLRVLAYDSEGRPGQGMLWTAICEQVTTRPER